MLLRCFHFAGSICDTLVGHVFIAEMHPLQFHTVTSLNSPVPLARDLSNSMTFGSQIQKLLTKTTLKVQFHTYETTRCVCVCACVCLFLSVSQLPCSYTAAEGVEKSADGLVGGQLVEKH